MADEKTGEDSAGKGTGGDTGGSGAGYGNNAESEKQKSDQQGGGDRK